MALFLSLFFFSKTEASEKDEKIKTLEIQVKELQQRVAVNGKLQKNILRLAIFHITSLYW